MATEMKPGRSRKHYRLRLMFLLCTPLFPVLLGCATESKAPPVTVAEAWQSRMSDSVSDEQAAQFAPAADRGSVFAVVGGVPINRSRVVDILIKSHGVGLLEQLIVLEAAKQRAQTEGVTVSQADVDAEYTRSLALLVGELFDNEPASLREKAAESLLDDMLKRRNSSRTEYMLVMERNAILRKLVEGGIVIDDASVSAEFNSLHGERVQIRHIQVSSRKELERLLDERGRGAEFGDLAVRYSANQASAGRLGLLPIFTRDDPNIPEAIRKEAFLLPTGQDSTPIYVDGWYHVIRVERRVAADDVSLDDVREEVERVLRNRLANTAVLDLHAELFNESEVEIVDPMLAELFYGKHPSYGGAER